MGKRNKWVKLAALVLGMGAFLLPMGVYAKTLTPDGQAVVVDSVTEGDGKDFYVFKTPDGNEFYLIIDHKRGNDNVYLLNAVTEADLAALVKLPAGSVSAVPECCCDKKCEAGKVDTDCPVCKVDLTVCKGKKADKTELPDEEKKGTEQSGGSGQSGEKDTAEKKSGNTGTLILVMLVAVAVGGGGYYLKIYKPKHDLDDADDLDDLLAEQEVNEDVESGSMARRRGADEEPEEDYGAYGDEPDEGYRDNGDSDGSYRDDGDSDGSYRNDGDSDGSYRNDGDSYKDDPNGEVWRED